MSTSQEDSKPAPPQDIQAQLFSALASSSRRTRPQGSSLATFQAESEVSDDNSRNKYDLLCPREGCGSVILLKGAATRVVKDTSEPIDSAMHALPASLPAIDHASPTTWWHIHGSPMVFENISFSKTVPSTTEGTAKKLLACAECEVGPLGWAEDTDYWLSTSRVFYRT